MFPRRLAFCKKLALSLFALALCVAPARAQIGVLLTGAGPVNRSMGGASTAAPLDASGALYWNPATISGLKGSEVGFGLEFLYPHAQLSSSVPANSFGPGIPSTGLAGSDHSDG